MAPNATPYGAPDRCWLDHDINVTKLLREAICKHADDWLAAELRRRGYFKTHEERRNSRTGSVSQVRVPVTAADTLAEGEFNRFYIRGVCRRAINEGIAEVVIYRAKEVEQPRPESEARRGQHLPAEAVLNDLRNSPGVDTALGLPSGPNSGLSVHLP